MDQEDAPYNIKIRYTLPCGTERFDSFYCRTLACARESVSLAMIRGTIVTAFIIGNSDRFYDLEDGK